MKQVTKFNGVWHRIEPADFMIGKKEYAGEPVTATTELNGKILMFTANYTFVLRPLRWYERVKLKLQQFWER